jgi:DNA-binding response OmpR family regulator
MATATAARLQIALAFWSRVSLNFGMGQKILFVDDEEDWRSVVSLSLQSAGFDVVTAKDATDGLAQAEGVDLGLIILDLNLGGESGMMLLKFLRMNHPGVPIMIYTGTEHDDQAIRGMLQQGADQYVRKGSMEELIVIVGGYFR